MRKLGIKNKWLVLSIPCSLTKPRKNELFPIHIKIHDITWPVLLCVNKILNKAKHTIPKNVYKTHHFQSPKNRNLAFTLRENI